MHGRGEGKAFGIPTANVAVNDDKVLPKLGVYACGVVIDGREFKAVTNLGEKPTVSDFTFSVEALIGDGFNGDLYGKEITVKFYKYLRDIKRFSDYKELAQSVLSDLKEWEDNNA